MHTLNTFRILLDVGKSNFTARQILQVFLQHPIHLVNSSFDDSVENAWHDQILGVPFRNVQLLADKRQSDHFVGFDDRQKDLGAYVFDEVLDVLADERVG